MTAAAAEPRLVDRVSEMLRRLGMRDVPLVVAVSGGADSAALLAVLAELREPLGLELTAAHLDHALRSESAEDADWVAERCRALRVPLISRRVSLASPTATVSEATSRGRRREFLAEAAASVRSPWVATAHTADDQAETVLHRLLRGTGPRGLAAIAPVAPLTDSIRLVRPLLDVTRAEVEAWLRSRSLNWRTDASNAELVFTRNRIRHQLLPLLRAEFNPQVTAALGRLAQQCREVGDWLRECAEEALATARLEQTAATVRLQIDRLASLPDVVRRELFVALWEQQSWPLQAMGFDEWQALADCALGRGPARFQLPDGIDVTRDHGVLRLRR